MLQGVLFYKKSTKVFLEERTKMQVKVSPGIEPGSPEDNEIEQGSNIRIRGANHYTTRPDDIRRECS